MTAIAHSIEIPPSSPLANQPLSKSAQTRHDVARIADDLAEIAEAAGWTVTQRRRFSGGQSIYLDMHVIRRVAITLRISNHSPNRPIGIAGERPTLLVLLGVPGCIWHAKTWLEKMGEKVTRMQEVHDRKCRLRRADTLYLS